MHTLWMLLKWVLILKKRPSYSVLYMFIELFLNEREASKEENDQSKSNESEGNLNFILSLLCLVTLHLHIFLHNFQLQSLCAIQ